MCIDPSDIEEEERQQQGVHVVIKCNLGKEKKGGGLLR